MVRKRSVHVLCPKMRPGESFDEINKGIEENLRKLEMSSSKYSPLNPDYAPIVRKKA
jgi:hypothetical protein